MATLAYLKSKLLLPEEVDDDLKLKLQIKITIKKIGIDKNFLDQMLKKRLGFIFFKGDKRGIRSIKRQFIM